MAHAEIRVTVNAWVDRGVAPLVRAFNRFPDLLTLDSCECDKNGEAFVYFCCRGDARMLLAHIQDLSTEIGKRHAFPDHTFRFSVQWADGGTEPLAILQVQPGHIRPLAETIAAIAETEKRIRKDL